MAVEILAFADETDVRFPALIGPRALAGTLNPSVFDLTDQSGVTIRKAMEDFGLSPDAAANLRRDAAGILGYAEVNIEQDPALETADPPLASRPAFVAFPGFDRCYRRKGHAGTVPIAGLRALWLPCRE